MIDDNNCYFEESASLMHMRENGGVPGETGVYARRNRSMSKQREAA